MNVITLCTEAEMRAYVAAHGRPVRPEPPYAILFPDSLLTHAAQHLRENGNERLEQLVLWGGYITPRGVALASLLLPETEATWGWVHILPAEQPKITAWLRDHGQLLFVEAHTHGHGSRATELSDEDRRHPAGRQDGFLTLIVPDYARNNIDVTRAGVWECQRLTWVRLTPEQVRSRLFVLSEQEARRVLG
jgi:hypothetical protein